MNSPFENQPISQDSPFKANGRFGRLLCSLDILIYASPCYRHSTYYVYFWFYKP